MYLSPYNRQKFDFYSKFQVIIADQMLYGYYLTDIIIAY